MLNQMPGMTFHLEVSLRDVPVTIEMIERMDARPMGLREGMNGHSK
ncbi:hypothetical protein HDF16_000249 [Granulicella aggregans]|uniref:Uncharacterized protein n=1 Tax=Granulicella aggregans TaxID=474949 RepID=A0A7W8E2X3_9BACT|nr:hypothetical protein [Granulicella aggregans]